LSSSVEVNSKAGIVSPGERLVSLRSVPWRLKEQGGASRLVREKTVTYVDSHRDSGWVAFVYGPPHEIKAAHCEVLVTPLKPSDFAKIIHTDYGNCHWQPHFRSS